MKFIALLSACSLAFLAGCAGSSNGDEIEVPTDLPPICRDIDFSSNPDMREICGVRKSRHKAYKNIPQQRYLIAPKNASLVREGDVLELRLQNSLPVELSGPIKRDMAFSQEKRLEKVKNTYEYVEYFKKGSPRKRVFKLGIPTDAGTSYDFCFLIPESHGSDRTRSAAMGNNVEQIQCSEFDHIKELKLQNK